MKKLNVIFSSIFWTLILLYPSTIRSIDYSNKNYGDENKNTILKRIKNSNIAEVNSFDLSKNHFGIIPGEYDDPDTISDGKALSNIFDKLTEFNNIETLRLSQNCLSPDKTLNSLNTLLMNLENIKILDLRDTSLNYVSSLSDDQLNNLINNISGLKHLEYLNISENFIYNVGADLLSEVILKLNNLKEIDLSFCNLWYKDGRERYDDDFKTSLKYDPTSFLKLAKKISQHENINRLRVSYYSGAPIKKEDLEKFKEIVEGKEIISKEIKKA